MPKSDTHALSTKTLAIIRALGANGRARARQEQHVAAERYRQDSCSCALGEVEAFDQVCESAR